MVIAARSSLGGSSGPIGEIKDAARKWLPVDAREEVEKQTLLWSGRGRHLVRDYLERLGMGIDRDPYPLQVGLLRYVVEQLAVAYRSPPTRYLRRNGVRVGDGDTAQTIAWETYERSQVDAMLRAVDLRRTLWRTCFVRLYASQVGQRVRLAIYPPTAVHREPDVGEPDELRADKRIAIERSDGSAELLEPLGDGRWQVTIYDARGQPEEGQVEVYDELPLVPFFDGLPEAPYLHPFEWRTEYVLKLALSANEVGAAVMYDVHPRGSLEKQPTPNGGPPLSSKPPMDVGPSQLAILDPGESLKFHQLQPQIAAISSATKETIELWFRAESLPTDSFRQSQTVSALGLQTLSQPLRERRESLLPFVVESERRLFAAFRALHNAYAEAWGRPWIDDSAEVDVVVGDIDVPVEPAAQTQQLASDMSLRLLSPIEAMMTRWGISRAEAIRRRMQVDEDFYDYAIEVEETAAGEIEGERPADPDPDEADMNPAASTTQTGRAAMMQEGG